MPTDQQVTAKMVLDATLELKRRGSDDVLQQLEALEPELTSYLLEGQSDLHQNLLALGGRAKPSQRVFREIQSLTLVCIMALRRGHLELWQQLMENTPAAGNAPPITPGAKPGTTTPNAAASHQSSNQN